MSAATVFNQVVYLSGQDSGTHCRAGRRCANARSAAGPLIRCWPKPIAIKARILSAQLFLKNLSDFQTVNALWIEWLQGHATPARATVQAELVRPGLAD
ncbi:Rid family hydrolase [Acinetobacter indicus]